MMQDHDDNCPALLQFACPIDVTKHGSSSRRRARYDRKALSDPKVLSKLNDVVYETPWNHPSVEPTSYIHTFQDHLSKWLPIIAPLPKCINRSSIMYDDTFQLLCRKHSLRMRAEGCGR